MKKLYQVCTIDSNEVMGIYEADSAADACRMNVIEAGYDENHEWFDKFYNNLTATELDEIEPDEAAFQRRVDALDEGEAMFEAASLRFVKKEGRLVECGDWCETVEIDSAREYFDRLDEIRYLLLTDWAPNEDDEEAVKNTAGEIERIIDEIRDLF